MSLSHCSARALRIVWTLGQRSECNRFPKYLRSVLGYSDSKPLISMGSKGSKMCENDQFPC
jgi:hypothetical protein